MDINLKVLGENIRRFRLRRQMTQRELADKCDLNRTYITDTESGNRNLSYLTLLKLARGLGRTVSDLTYNLEVLASMRVEARSRKSKSAAAKQRRRPRS
jgi:transcriptional regulator with XRE-family HTH domain